MAGPAIGRSGNFSIGVNAAGNLTIQNGSTFTSSGGAVVRLGQDTAGVGIVTVTGAGSQWIVSGPQLNVANNGTGILNIQNGGQVIAQNGVGLGLFAGSSGTLNISGGGILETTGMVVGTGTRQVNFDNAVVRALANNAAFFGAPVNQINIAAGGTDIRHQWVQHRNARIQRRRRIDQDRRRDLHAGLRQYVYRSDGDPAGHACAGRRGQ
ncbi:hypothetical protein [Bradyrhizobium cenepequi]